LLGNWLFSFVDSYSVGVFFTVTFCLLLGDVCSVCGFAWFISCFTCLRGFDTLVGFDLLVLFMVLILVCL